MPQVESSTSSLLPGSPCKHRTLFFGSGGYYVICSICSYMWVAKDPMSHEDRPDPNFQVAGLNHKDKRVEQTTAMDSSAQSTCQHDKVYANFILTSNPPQYPWICRKCGLEGTDKGTVYSVTDEYNQLIQKFGHL